MSGETKVETETKLSQFLKQLPPGACFGRCYLASFTENTLRCMIAMPERQVRFLVLASSVRDDRGDFISAGQPIQAWQEGWVLGELAGTGNGPGHYTLVRIRQTQADSLEVEVGAGDVILCH
jgi:hypothetical protein